MLELYFRPLYQKYMVDPVARRLNPYVSARKITFLGALLGLLVLPALWLQQAWLGCLLLLLSGYCDTLDGTLARMQHEETPLGAVLDIVFDRIVECAVVLGLFSVAPDTRDWLCLLMLSSIMVCVTSFLVVGVFIEKDSYKSFHYSPGFMERAEAFIFFIAMMFLPGYFALLAAVFVLLVLLTGFWRIYQFALATRS